MSKKSEKEYDELQHKIDMFEDYEKATINERAERETDHDYYDGIQWTQDEINALGKNGRPVITNNRIKPKIDAIIGLCIQLHTDPKAYARTPKHNVDADAVTDVLKYIADKSDMRRLTGELAKDLSIYGLSVLKTLYKLNKKNEVEISIKRVPWNRFFYDPYSQRNDFADARYMGEVSWVDIEDAKATYPGNDELIEASMNMSDMYISDTYDDTGRIAWCDKNRRRIRIVECWYKKGEEWYQCIFTRAGFLLEPIPSKLVNEWGDTYKPYSPISLHIRRDGCRYGLVNQLRSLQDELNKRRSKALDFAISRKARISSRFEGREDEFKERLQDPAGIIVAERDEFDLIPNSEFSQGQFALLNESKNEIEASGVDAGVLNLGDRASAKSLQARLSASNTQFVPFIEALSTQQRFIYEIVWQSIRQYWTEEKWIRVTDDAQNTKFVALNRQVTNRDLAVNQDPSLTDNPDPYLDEPSGELINNVSEMEIDIIIDQAPDSISVQQEQYQQLLELFGPLVNNNPTLQPIVLELLIQSSMLRDKDKLLKGLKSAQEQLAPAQQQQQQLKQIDAQIEMERKQAETAKIKADAVKKQTEAEKNIVEIQRAQLGQEDIG